MVQFPSCKAYYEQKIFTWRLDGATELNNDLNIKLDDAWKHAEKFCLGLKKANRMLKQLEEKVKKP